MKTLWLGIVILGSVCLLLVIIISFTINFYPAERPLTLKFKQALRFDVIVVEVAGFDTDLAIQNVRQMLGDMCNEVYSMTKETDLLSRHSLARITRFILITKANMLITCHLSPNDLFGRDEVPYITTNNFQISPVPDYDRDMLRQLGIVFQIYKPMYTSLIPIVVDQLILLELMENSKFLMKPPSEIVFHFYLNYVWMTSRAIRSKKHSFHFLKSQIEQETIKQRKFIYLNTCELQKTTCEIIDLSNKNNN
jgi:hypothetical protein